MAPSQPGRRAKTAASAFDAYMTMKQRLRQQGDRAIAATAGVRWPITLTLGMQADGTLLVRTLATREVADLAGFSWVGRSGY